MSDDVRPPRRYDEKEIGRLLERATELQRDEASTTGPSGGMALAELEEIAKEAGIDPRYLRRAARELDTRSDEAGPWDTVVGAPLTLAFERTFPGEIEEGDFEALAVEIQHRSGASGQPSLLGRTLIWRAESASGTRSLQVSVTSRDGETTIRIEERLHQFASGLFGGTVAGGGVGVGMGVGIPVGMQVLGSTLFAVAFPLGAVGLAWVGCRAIYRAVVARRGRALQDLLERLSEQVEAAIEKRLERGDERPGLPPGG